MTHLVIHTVGTDAASKAESILAKVESTQYTPDILDALVNACLSDALAAVSATNLGSLRSLHPEVSVSLTTTDEETVRPSLHLSRDTIQRLAEAGATFDFDPYV